jgi:hypothetical protein
MVPIDQTILNLKTGDCMAACVASIFEVRLEQIPNFMENGAKDFNEKLDTWADAIGLRTIDMRLETSEDILRDCYVIAVGPSPRDPENHNHSIVWYNGKMVHDPHPSRDGIVGEPEVFTVFIVKDLSWYEDGL